MGCLLGREGCLISRLLRCERYLIGRLLRLNGRLNGRLLRRKRSEIGGLLGLPRGEICRLLGLQRLLLCELLCLLRREVGGLLGLPRGLVCRLLRFAGSLRRVDRVLHVLAFGLQRRVGCGEDVLEIAGRHLCGPQGIQIRLDLVARRLEELDRSLPVGLERRDRRLLIGGAGDGLGVGDQEVVLGLRGRQEGCDVRLGGRRRIGGVCKS